MKKTTVKTRLMMSVNDMKAEGFRLAEADADTGYIEMTAKAGATGVTVSLTSVAGSLADALASPEAWQAFASEKREVTVQIDTEDFSAVTDLADALRPYQVPLA